MARPPNSWVWEFFKHDPEAVAATSGVNSTSVQCLVCGKTLRYSSRNGPTNLARHLIRSHNKSQPDSNTARRPFESGNISKGEIDVSNGPVFATDHNNESSAHSLSSIQDHSGLAADGSNIRDAENRSIEPSLEDAYSKLRNQHVQQDILATDNLHQLTGLDQPTRQNNHCGIHNRTVGLTTVLSAKSASEISSVTSLGENDGRSIGEQPNNMAVLTKNAIAITGDNNRNGNTCTGNNNANNGTIANNNGESIDNTNTNTNTNNNNITTNNNNILPHSNNNQFSIYGTSVYKSPTFFHSPQNNNKFNNTYNQTAANDTQTLPDIATSNKMDHDQFSKCVNLLPNYKLKVADNQVRNRKMLNLNSTPLLSHSFRNKSSNSLMTISSTNEPSLMSPLLPSQKINQNKQIPEDQENYKSIQDSPSIIRLANMPSGAITAINLNTSPSNQNQIDNSQYFSNQNSFLSPLKAVEMKEIDSQTTSIVETTPEKTSTSVNHKKNPTIFMIHDINNFGEFELATDKNNGAIYKDIANKRSAYEEMALLNEQSKRAKLDGSPTQSKIGASLAASFGTAESQVNVKKLQKHQQEIQMNMLDIKRQQQQLDDYDKMGKNINQINGMSSTLFNEGILDGMFKTVKTLQESVKEMQHQLIDQKMNNVRLEQKLARNSNERRGSGLEIPYDILPWIANKYPEDLPLLSNIYVLFSLSDKHLRAYMELYAINDTDVNLSDREQYLDNESILAGDINTDNDNENSETVSEFIERKRDLFKLGAFVGCVDVKRYWHSHLKQERLK